MDKHSRHVSKSDFYEVEYNGIIFDKLCFVIAPLTRHTLGMRFSTFVIMGVGQRSKHVPLRVFTITSNECKAPSVNASGKTNKTAPNTRKSETHTRMRKLTDSSED